jgi:hypothetical protein
MSMFYTAYVATNENSEEFKKTVTGIMPNILGTSNENNILSIRCEYFLLHFLNDIEYAKIRGKDYGMEFNQRLWFDIYRNNPVWTVEFLKFIGRLLHLYPGDFVLEYNGETCVLMRKNGEIIVDDSGMRGYMTHPFNALGLPYKEGEIKQV